MPRIHPTPCTDPFAQLRAGVILLAAVALGAALWLAVVTL